MHLLKAKSQTISELDARVKCPRLNNVAALSPYPPAYHIPAHHRRLTLSLVTPYQGQASLLDRRMQVLHAKFETRSIRD